MSCRSIDIKPTFNFQGFFWLQFKNVKEVSQHIEKRATQGPEPFFYSFIFRLYCQFDQILRIQTGSNSARYPPLLTLNVFVTAATTELRNVLAFS